MREWLWGYRMINCRRQYFLYNMKYQKFKHMKIEIKILLVTLFISSKVAAQNTWVQKADYAGGVRTGSAGFSIGSKGYLGVGAKKE